MQSRTTKELVLLYRLGPDTQKGQKIHQILTTMGITTVDILPERLGDPLGLLVGYQGFTAAQDYPGPYPQEEFLVMRDIQGKRMDNLLLRLREEKASVSLKAVVTDTNKSWTMLALLQELQEEHHVMGLWRKLQQLVGAPDESLAASDEAYEAILSRGKTLLADISAGREIAPQEMQEIVATLEKFTE